MTRLDGEAQRGAMIVNYNSAWRTSIGAMIDNDVACKARCRKCEQWKDVDLVKLAAYKGRDYCLWNKRTNCHITKGCFGEVVFMHNGNGYFRNMFDD